MCARLRHHNLNLNAAAAQAVTLTDVRVGLKTHGYRVPDWCED